MEYDIDITRFYYESIPKAYSASVAEIGLDAGFITWGQASHDAETWNLLQTPEQLEAMRSFALNSGGWNNEEIAAWTPRDLNALFIQWVSGDIRNSPLDGNREAWALYEEEASEGSCSSNIYHGDDGKVYYYLGT